MLWIGKLAVGQADYCLERAPGSVTRAGAVSSGVEDYYLGGGEASAFGLAMGCGRLGSVGRSTRCGSIGC